MSKSTLQAFSSGILSPDLDASTEVERHRYGLKECTNMIINPLGGVKNRAGTQYIADCYNTSEQSRIIAFQFNTEQAYILEFGDLKMRIIVDGALVGGPTEIPSPYAIADVQDLYFESSADTIFVYHPDYDIYQIRRTSDTAWSIFKLGDTAFTSKYNGPYTARVSGDEDTTVEAVFSGFPTFVWTIQSSKAIFGSIAVDDVVKLGFPVTGDPLSIRWAHFKITGITSSSIVDADELVVNDTGIRYEQISNHDFTNSTTFWEEYSDSGSAISHDATNQRLIMTDGAGGNAKTEQAVLVQSRVAHILLISVVTLTGATPRVTLNVGTTSFGSEITGPVLITSTGITTYDILPTTDTIYISLDTLGSTDTDVVEISDVSLEVTKDYKASENPRWVTNDWRLPKWNAVNGRPSRGIIDGQRLISANLSSEPQTFFASQLGAFVQYDSSTPSLNTDSFSFIPAVGELNGIKWMVEHDGLKAGTSNEIFSIYASSGGVITPTDVNTKIVSAVGSLDLKPLVIGNSLIMTPRGHEAVSEMTASNEAQGYVPRDLSIFASHLFEDRRIVRWVYARNPDSIIWCVLDNGELLGLTYKKDYDVWAWHRHTTPLGEGFKDIAIIPNSSDDNIDEVYFVINRAELGETPNHYIEKLNKRITSQTAAFGLSASGTPYDYKFLDSALTYDVATTITGATKADPVVITDTGHPYINGDFIRIQNVLGMTEINNNVYKIANKAANTYQLNDADDNTIDGTGFTTYLAGGESRKMETTFAGLDHLEGKTVSALGDGVVETGLVVSSGSITLASAASFVHVGLPYISEIETLDIETMFRDTGSTQGMLKSVTNVTAYFKDTRGAEVADSDVGTYFKIPFNDEAYGEDPPPLYNGSKEVVITSIPTKEKRVKIRQTEPLPIHIKRLIFDVEYTG